MSRTPALFAVACPGCRATVAVDRGLVGEAARCPVCPAVFVVPDPGPAPPAERERPAAAESRAAGEAQAAPAGAAATPEATAVRPDEPADERAGRGPAEEALPRHLGADVGGPPGRRPVRDERSRRRSRRTLVLMVGGITLLMVLAVTLGRRPRRSRR